MWQLLAIAAGTLASEDLTCLATGALIGAGHVSPFAGVFTCFIGIYLGDVALWLLGRVGGRRILSVPWVACRVDDAQLRRASQFVDGRIGKLVLTSRFIPGSRLPMYLAVGVLGRATGRFLCWTFVAALVWTPLVVLLAAWLGDAFVAPLREIVGTGRASLVASIVVALLILRGLATLFLPPNHVPLRTRISRVWRWEFWPAWLFYLPLVPWVAALAVRYRGIMTIAVANPGIPFGGIVGESKAHILRKLPPQWVLPFHLLRPGAVEERVTALQRAMAEHDWTFPLVLKPDASQRGAGVKLVRSIEEATVYFESHPRYVLAQVYHRGPYEAGIFYYRLPGESSGRIFSICDKVFPVLVGDGSSTLEQLVLAHPRFALQAGVFLARHASNRQRVLAPSERFPLAIAGNHCQGTLFRDGAHLATPSLEQRIDAIASRFDGFYFGRFDVRYADAGQFMAGEDLAIIELNGATSESTNLYDPERSLLFAYRTLFRQWHILFQVGHRNRVVGHHPPALQDLLRTIRSYYRDREDDLSSD